MGKIAFLFAGQGSQYPGMGKDFYENIDEVRSFFDEAEVLRPGTLKQMFEGTREELMRTDNTQPCLYLTDLAAAMALEEEGIEPDMVVGFSLGEVAAVAMAGILTGEEAFRLVCARGRLMQQAVEKSGGSMVAVMRMPREELEPLCRECGVYPVNFNCPGQIVVSGDTEGVERLKGLLQAKKVRAIPLAVGGCFHTPYMQSAAKGLYEELDQGAYNVQAAKRPVYSNKTAEVYPTAREDIMETLATQIANSVKWEDTLYSLQQAGVDTFIECGPGNTLSGFVRRTLEGVKSFQVSDMDSLRRTVEALQ